MRDMRLQEEALVRQNGEHAGALAVHEGAQVNPPLETVVEAHMQDKPALRLNSGDTPRHTGRD